MTRYETERGDWADVGRAYVLFDPSTQTEYVFGGAVDRLTPRVKVEIVEHLVKAGVVEDLALRQYGGVEIFNRLPIGRIDGLKCRVEDVKNIETGEVREMIAYEYDAGVGSRDADKWKQYGIGALGR